ncbi:MAG TPA: YCF48-related protein [Pyrinomonadaceae bacterium]|nr:YCF48-related protein [Pyrinomonadaceae bacterium]
MPTKFPFRAVETISPTEAWAVSDGGELVHTTDGGATWDVREINTSAVHFKDALHGWAIGSSGSFYTTDGGKTWNAGAGVSTTVSSIAFADLSTGFAARNTDTLHKTTDGGRTWSLVPVPTYVNRVQFFDSRNGVATGPYGVVRTTDGGRTWAMWANTHGGFFVNLNEGWYLTGNIAERTTDGGRTWQQTTLPPVVSVLTYTFVDSQHGWAAGVSTMDGAVNIIRTTDGGATWTTQAGGPLNTTGPFWAIDFADAMHGTAVGNSALFTTTDGGVTWVRRMSGSPNEVLGFSSTDGRHAWASQINAEVAYTTDGGNFWHRVSLPIDGGNQNHAEDVDFSDNMNGWVVGGVSSLVYHSTDGGRSYQRRSTGFTASLFGVEAIDARNVVVVGYASGWHGPIVLRTTDGGATWAEMPNPFRSYTRWSFYAVHFVNATTGWAVGSNGIVIKTTDGGATWVDKSVPGLTVPLSDVSFADANNGWVVGYYGALFRTRDGGQTWEQQDAGTTYAILSVSAVSPTTAWIGCYGTPGFAARTLDGGATWAREHPEADPTANNGVGSFSAVHFLNAERGWAAGYSGIYRRGGAEPAVPEPSLSLALNPTSVTGTKPSTATVTLTEPAPSTGAKVLLSSSDTSAATVPAYVTVAAGTTTKTFTVTTKAVSAPTNVNISATYEGETKTATLGVAPPVLTSLTLNLSSITGPCQTTKAGVNLSAKAPPGGVVINLTNGNPAAVVPASVTVPAGYTSATFTITAAQVSAKTSGAITAKPADANFGVTGYGKTLTVLPIGVQTLVFSPNPVGEQGVTTGTLTLVCPVPAGSAPVIVKLASSATGVAAPTVSSVSVPAGSDRATFSVVTKDVSVTSYATISAKANGLGKNVKLTVNPR